MSFIRKKNNFSILFLVFILCACNETEKIESENEDKKDTFLVNSIFKEFLNNFHSLPSGMVLNTTCLDVSKNKKYKKMDIAKFKDLLDGYEGPAIAIGYISDTTKFYNLIYATSSACYLPNLSVYNKKGELIETCLLASGCGSDMGYECSEKVQFINSNKIITIKNEKYYETDSLGHKIDASVEEIKSKISYSITINGNIKIDTLN